MDQLTAAWMFLTAAILETAIAVNFQRGRVRTLGWWYLDTATPFYARRVAFTAIPGAAVLYCWSFVLFSSMETGKLESSNMAEVILFVLSIVFLGWFVRRLLGDPPKYLQPKWMRDLIPMPGGSSDFIEQQRSVSND